MRFNAKGAGGDARHWGVASSLDVIHYQNGNNRDDMPVRFTVTMLCEPGKPMLTFVDEDELIRRKDRRAPRAN